ncbi:MAG TPA: hypothetical protein VJY15_04835 [Candidatus Acidoferrum sp.]|nr:hypothetical protein [Candidatus Acidoferrum sp.]
MGALAAFHRYADRTVLTDKSLKGTKEALEILLAYLGRSLADAVSPTIERILDNATTTPEGTIREIKRTAIATELNGEGFFDDISSFVNSDIEEMLFYRNLVHARLRWSTWAKRISKGVFTLLILQGFFTLYFFGEKILSRPVTLVILLATFVLSALVVGFCFLCAGAMLHYHDQISEYRDKVL